MKTTLYIQDIECDSCVRIVDRSIKRLQGINEFSVKNDHVLIDYDPSLIKEETIVESISRSGYKTSTTPISHMSYKQRWRDFTANKRKYWVEWRMLIYTAVAFLFLLGIDAALYLIFFAGSQGFLSHYWQWFIYLDITIVTVAAGLWHLKAYRGAITSMTGMMLGMTLGMQAGFMVGAVVGATNGMFTGSMAGMFTGVFLGGYAGKDSGIMGALQGIMSGLMGGTMGAMLTVMLLADHISLFMPFFMAVNVVILWGMSYMVYEEMVEDKRVQVAPAEFGTLFSWVFVAAIVLGLIMVYGPKSLLVAIH